MEPALIGTRVASAAISPLLKRLLVRDGSGAGLTEKPVRLSGLVSFRGEKRSLTEKDVRRLAGTLVRRALADRGERPVPPEETEAIAEALSRALLALGDLDMDDVQAVRLGHRELARRLHTAGGGRASDGLSADASLFLESLTEWACLHILQFFTQRSSFVARTLVEQSRAQSELIAKVDELILRVPRADARDVDFERRYLSYLAKKHGSLTIYGIDLHDSPDAWPLDAAYLSLEASAPPRTVAESPGSEGPAANGGPMDSAVAGHTAFDLMNRMATETRPADQALAEHPHVLLRGVAGSGKTTLVQWLTVATTSPHPDARMTYLRGRIPFVLPLRTLTRHGEQLPAPERFLAAVGCPLPPPDGWADRVLSAGRGLVLVDGIDEVPEGERERTRRWLRDLLAVYDEGNRWLVTSRPSAVRDDWLAAEGFTELTLSPMSRTEVTAFVQRWHRAAGPAAQPYQQPLLDALRTKQDLARLAVNPLMCGLICALHRDRRGFLPRGRKALYEAALSMLLARRDRERDMGTPSGVDLPEGPQIQLIQRLAHWLTLNGRTEMDHERARSLVLGAIPAVPEAAAAGDPQAVFGHLLHRSGLLREPSPGAVDFVHRTFQDYLAAKAIVDEWHIGVLTRHAADDQWEDVIRMSVAHARPRECAEIFTELLAAADAAPDRRRQLRTLVVTAAAMEQATEISPAIRDAVLRRTAEVIPPRTRDEARELAAAGPLVLDLLPGPEDVREHTAARLTVVTASHIASDAAIPFLARYASHESLAVRSQLVWAWDRYDTEQYATDVIAAVDPEGLHFTVRNAEQAGALMALGGGNRGIHFHGDLPEGLIAETVRGCSPPVVRISGAAGLRDLGCLRDAHALESFQADRCPALTDLTALARTPVSEILLDDEQLAVLDAVPAVDRLCLELRSLDLSLHHVPALFPDITAITLVHRFHPGHPVDLTPLLTLHQLTSLHVVGDREKFAGSYDFPIGVHVTFTASA